MKTLTYAKTYTSAISNEDVFDIRVNDNSGCVVHIQPGDATTIIKTLLVWLDPDTGKEATTSDYNTFDSSPAGEAALLSNGESLYFMHYPYKVPYLRVKVISTGTSGTLRISADVWS